MNFGADLIFFFFLAFLVFGPKKLPEIARLVGKTMGELRRASNEFRFSLEEEIRNAELAEEAKKAQATLSAHPAALPEAEEAEYGPESDPAWKDVEGLRDHGDADADAAAEFGRTPHANEWDGEPREDAVPEVARAAAAARGAEAGGEEELAAEGEAEPEPPGLPAERQGGVPGTVPAAEPSWPAPERRT
ncbi:MAG: twin-arginine translocase TatA/TatE family subunit [Terriglobales bacterium]